MKTEKYMEAKDVVVNLVGKSYAEAESLCKEHKIALRIRSRNGVSYIGTCDCRFDRINVDVDDNRIVTATIG